MTSSFLLSIPFICLMLTGVHQFGVALTKGACDIYLRGVGNHTLPFMLCIYKLFYLLALCSIEMGEKRRDRQQSPPPIQSCISVVV